MKRKIRYVDWKELNGERLGPPGPAVRLDFLPAPEQVRRCLQTVPVTISLAPSSLAYFQRLARRRNETPAELMQRILEAHALAGA
jgi:hypothetical protein